MDGSVGQGCAEDVGLDDVEDWLIWRPFALMRRARPKGKEKKNSNRKEIALLSSK
ncbi:MAG: hypothetical protein ACFFCS_26510 [Candidatus Hodarchaeota archaeon]